MALLNPPAERLGKENAILSGRTGRRGHLVPPFAGPLSLKTVLRGEAVWRTQDATFRVEPGQALILNAGQKYTLTIEPGEFVETLCIFFQDGWVEDVWRGNVEAASNLLDNPEPPPEPAAFLETLRVLPAEVQSRLLRLRDALGKSETVDGLSSDEHFGRLAFDLLDAERSLRRRASAVPAARASTRIEMLKRLLVARDFIDGDLSEPLSLRSIARSACLSPFHCHRLFLSVFGETPHGYLTRRRLERAQSLLARSDRDITQVCLDVGFTSLGSFSNLFRRRFGVAPSAYRRLQKSKIQ